MSKSRTASHIFIRIFFIMESLVFEQKILFRVYSLSESLCDLRPQGLVPRDGARGKNLVHLRFFFHFLLFIFFDGIICI